MDGLTLYALLKFIVRRPRRCAFHLILSYGAPLAVRLIKVYRTSDPLDVRSKKNIVHPTPQMYTSEKISYV